MFESLPTVASMDNKEFEHRASHLRQQLLQVQRNAKKLKRAVIIIVAGLDGAGKGSAVHRLNEWMDARGIDTHAFMDSSDEEQARPFYWRFWRRLPEKGRIGIFFGSWYTQPQQAALAGILDNDALVEQARKIAQFEKMLADDGTVIIKLWYHLSSETQYKQLSHKAPATQQNLTVPVSAKRTRKNYKTTLKIAEHLIAATHTNQLPWHIVQAHDKNHRDIASAEHVLNAMLTATETTHTGATQAPIVATTRPTLDTQRLRQIDLDQVLSKKDYRRLLTKYQSRLQKLAWEFHEQKRSMTAVFEGWDAAGKGSAIRRITNAIDPRLYKVLRFAAPTEQERRQHYLWRFWRKLERDGRTTIFDRSWYGRVLVERVEEFATVQEWQRAYEEINQFEQQLVDHGTTVLKFWLHISPQEQLKRFRARQQQPHKRYKITEEDWRNRNQREVYESAIEDMLRLTDSDQAPWILVAGNNKRFARIQILKSICKAMDHTLNKG